MTVPMPCAYTSIAPSARIVPQCAHVARAVVRSETKSSLRIPAAALPSSLASSSLMGYSFCSRTDVALRRPARRPEALGFHQRRLVSELDERIRDTLHERCGTTDEYKW